MNTTCGSRTGSALLTVLGIVAVVTIVCGMLSVSATQQMRSAQITREMLKARMIAESGLNKAYNEVKGNFALAQGYSLAESFADGSYKVYAAPLTGTSSNRAQLIATGTYGMGKAVVAADLENRPLSIGSSGTDNYYSLPFDLLVGGTMTLKGNFNASVTAIHSNGSADLGGSASVDAITVSSAGSVEWKKAPADVTLLPNQPAQVIYPDDLAAAINALKSYAQDHGAVYSSAASIPASPPGGVAYCTGSDSGWSGSGAGCFIFEGDFSSKHITVTSVNNYPVLIVLSPSSIQFNAGTVISGAALFPLSSLRFNGHAEIDGPLLVGQSITGNGTADLYAGSGQGFAYPPQAELEDNVVITAWH